MGLSDFDILTLLFKFLSQDISRRLILSASPVLPLNEHIRISAPDITRVTRQNPHGSWLKTCFPGSQPSLGGLSCPRHLIRPVGTEVGTKRLLTK